MNVANPIINNRLTQANPAPYGFKTEPLTNTNCVQPLAHPKSIACFSTKDLASGYFRCLGTAVVGVR
jgi:hypothetical protein